MALLIWNLRQTGQLVLHLQHDRAVTCQDIWSAPDRSGAAARCPDEKWLQTEIGQLTKAWLKKIFGQHLLILLIFRSLESRIENLFLHYSAADQSLSKELSLCCNFLLLECDCQKVVQHKFVQWRIVKWGFVKWEIVVLSTQCFLTRCPLKGCRSRGILFVLCLSFCGFIFFISAFNSDIWQKNWTKIVKFFFLLLEKNIVLMWNDLEHIFTDTDTDTGIDLFDCLLELLFLKRRLVIQSSFGELLKMYSSWSKAFFFDWKSALCFVMNSMQRFKKHLKPCNVNSNIN